MEPDKPNEEHVLKDGTKVTVRAIRPADGDLLRESFKRLSPESRYRRFFSGISELSDEAIRYLTDVDGHNHVAIVAVVDSLDLKVEDGLGVARFVRLAEDPDVAEAAVTVMDNAQRKGLGRLLLAMLVERARDVGVKRFRAEVLSDNEPMMKLLTDAGATMRRTNEGTVVFDVPIEGANSKGADDGELSLVERFFHAAATSLTIFLRSLRPPPLESETALEGEEGVAAPGEGAPLPDGRGTDREHGRGTDLEHGRGTDLERGEGKQEEQGDGEGKQEEQGDGEGRQEEQGDGEGKQKEQGDVDE